MDIRRVRKVSKINQQQYYEKYNYLCIFKKVQRNIKNFIHETFNPILYPNLQTNIDETLLHWKNVIFEKYMQYIDVIQMERLNENLDENVFETLVFEKAINVIGFTIWYCYKLKFPKKLCKKTFSKNQCSEFIEISKFFCNHLIDSLKHIPNFRNQRYYLFVLLKIIRILE